ncbi:hypothetical protein KP509_19G059800 [Ceratopteris richardii]|uniref:RING-type E3 ubiquitin transferase n=1 Tax=Ceratopteris richardii TaxID=49495 RepID=A0A8T2SPF4_CERRI|nr:hypothetical protein KP509_19G059800 [Ceratopteris richardii]
MGPLGNSTHMLQISVPKYFLCPISLELMSDPVTLRSGQTFDRSSIQQWLDDGNSTCPVTRMPIDPDQDEPIPNHALRRMIQNWCVQNRACGVERIRTPRQPPSLKDIPNLLEQVRLKYAGTDQDSWSHDRTHLQNGRGDALEKLCMLASDRPKARNLLVRADALPVIFLCLSRSLALVGRTETLPPTEIEDILHLLALLIEEAEIGQTRVSWQPGSPEDVHVLAKVMAGTRTNIDVSRDAALVLSKAEGLVDCMKRISGEISGCMSTAACLLLEASGVPVGQGTFTTPRPSEYHAKAGLDFLLALCKPSSQMQRLATDAGVLNALCNVLRTFHHESPQQHSLTANAVNVIEAALRVWVCLCRCADGRLASWDFLGPVIGVICNVSRKASTYSIHILWLLLKHAPVGAHLARNVVDQGAYSKVMSIAHYHPSPKTRNVANKIINCIMRFVPQSQICIKMH